MVEIDFIVLTYDCSFCGSEFELTTNTNLKNTMVQCYACGNFLEKTKFKKRRPTRYYGDK